MKNNRIVSQAERLEALQDLAPKGRDDALEFTMAWIRHHDRYGAVISHDMTESVAS